MICDLDKDRRRANGHKSFPAETLFLSVQTNSHRFAKKKDFPNLSEKKSSFKFGAKHFFLILLKTNDCQNNFAAVADPLVFAPGLERIGVAGAASIKIDPVVNISAIF